MKKIQHNLNKMPKVKEVIMIKLVKQFYIDQKLVR